MQIREIKIEVKEFGSLSELPEQDRKLVRKAREASNNAYAPYSKFNVGAALLLENGKIITGNNQENVDFTDGLCAERVALFYAQSKYPDIPVKAIAITAQNTKGLLDAPTKPCGSCRQVMLETEFRNKTPMRIILDGKKKIQILEGAGNLLPLAFKPGTLDE